MYIVDTQFVYSVHTGCNRVLNLLELELQSGVSYPVGSSN